MLLLLLLLLLWLLLLLSRPRIDRGHHTSSVPFNYYGVCFRFYEDFRSRSRIVVGSRCGDDGWAIVHTDKPNQRSGDVAGPTLDLVVHPGLVERRLACVVITTWRIRATRTKNHHFWHIREFVAAVDDADAFLGTQCDRACLKGKNMCTATGSSEAGGAYSVTIVYRNSSGQSERMNRSKFFGTWLAAGESAGAAAGGGP